MAPIQPLALACKTTDKYDSAPILRSHAGDSGLDDDKGTSCVDLKHVVPVALFNIRDISYTATQPSIGYQYRDGLVLCSNDVCLKQIRDEIPRSLTR
jgi:hypothetical protein